MVAAIHLGPLKLFFAKQQTFISMLYIPKHCFLSVKLVSYWGFPGGISGEELQSICSQKSCAWLEQLMWLGCKKSMKSSTWRKRGWGLLPSWSGTLADLGVLQNLTLRLLLLLPQVFKSLICGQKIQKELGLHPSLQNRMSQLFLCSFGLPWWLRRKSVCLQCRRPGFNPWVGKIPGEGNDNPLQYSCLENSKDRGI